MIVAPIPIHGRRALFPWTIKRLKDIGVEPICIVNADKDLRLLQQYGVRVIKVSNMTLGEKWNRVFTWAGTLNPEAVLYVGSGDWVSSNWIEKLLPFIGEYDMVGVPGCHFLHRAYSVKHGARSLGDFTHKLGFWAGYTGDREGESCGGGRLLSARILDKMDWKPFRKENNRNMDYNMLYKVMVNGGRIKLYKDTDVKGLSISTDLWGNMHDFDTDMRTPGSYIIDNVKEFLTEHFKEALELWNVDGVYSQMKRRQ